MKKWTAYLIFLALLGNVLALPVHAGEPGKAVTAADIVWDQCIVWGDGKELGKAPRNDLAGLLGIEPSEKKAEWTTAPLAGEIRHFRIAFTKPVAIGTICSEYADATGIVSYLRPQAAAPGDVTRDDDWIILPHGMVKTLPPSTKTQALRFTHHSINLPWEENRRPSSMPKTLLLSDRFWNPAQLGSGEWSAVQTGKGKKNSQWIGYWPKGISISAAAILTPLPNGTSFAFFPDASDQHPLAADSTIWQTVAGSDSSKAPSCISFSTATSSKGLRVLMSENPRGSDAQAACLPLAALKQDESAPTSFIPDAPFKIKYPMPLDGFIAMRMADKGGNDVRRLVAEVERTTGEIAEPWDLMDDEGRYVKPGKYAWRGIARPPLKLTYEITVYNAGRPPWMAPVPGGGWWMSDHCPPRAVCATKDKLFFGAQGAEFGIPLIATDLEGRKVWHFNQGVERLCSDGRYAYVVNDDAVIRFDPENNFERKEILKFSYTDQIPNRMEQWIQADFSGAACGNGLLAVSYQAPEPPWIAPAFNAGDIALKLCYPPSGTEKVHETAYTPTERILGAFLTIQSSQQAFFGKAADKGPMKNVLLLALNKDVPIGSVMIPNGEIQVWALRPGKSLPASFRADAAGGPTGTALDAGTGEELGELSLSENADGRFDDKIWLSLKGGTSGRPDIALTPAKGATTQYLAFTSPNLQQLDYALVLNRRYRDASADAALVFCEGQKQGKAGWSTGRDDKTPLSSGNPAIAGMVWSKPVPMRGLAILRPMARAGICLDIWTGAPDAKIGPEELKNPANWKQVYRHVQNENHIKLGWHNNTVITCDLGETMQVRAVRVRIVDSPTRGAKSVGGFESIVAFQPLGEDPELPKNLTQRITVVELPKDDKSNAKIIGHIQLAHPSALAFDKDGSLVAASADGIVRIRDAAAAATAGKADVQPLIAKDLVKRPRSMIFAADGMLHVLDGDTKAVQVFDPKTGGKLHTVGTPGGVRPGPYDPTRFTEPVAMSFDSANKLWVVEQSFQPKRISRWSQDGKYEKDFQGPTHYGGGGVVDPGDHSVVNHLGMKFRVDWPSRTWKLESILAGYCSRGMYLPDRTVYLGKRRYLVGDGNLPLSFGDPGPTAVICEEKDGVAVPLVAAGLLSGWASFGGNEEVLASYASKDQAKTSFVWCDLNRDGKATMDEVQVRDGDMFRNIAGIGDDLSLNFYGTGKGWRLRTKAVRDDGIPQYDLKSIEEVPGLDQRCMATADGETFVMGHHYLDRTGKTLWSYPDRFMSVQLSNQVPWGFYDRPAGVLCGGLLPAGQFEIGGEKLFCVNGNNGDYYAFTRDGLLAATIVGGPRGYGKRFFSMPECEPGKTDLTDLRKTVEDFHGWICKAEDGKVYATVGKNHVTMIRADGLEKMKRLSGDVEVTSADLQAAAKWADEKSRIERALRRPCIQSVPYLTKKPVIDGDIASDWPVVPAMPIHEIRGVTGQVQESWSATLAYDAQNLYVSARGFEPSPLVNSVPDAERKRIFQFGDGFDLHLGLDPKADPNRTEPVPGDIRLILTAVGDTPAVMLYRYRVPNGSGNAVKFTSPVAENVIDEIRDISSEVTMKFRRRGGGSSAWTIEAAIPWKVLGFPAPAGATSLRGDVGTLVSDPNGMSTVTRYYWANKTNVVMSDLPAESRILPSTWGEFRFATPELGMDDVGGDAPGTDEMLKNLE